jgi:hypothetical protein
MTRESGTHVGSIASSYGKSFRAALEEKEREMCTSPKNKMTGLLFAETLPEYFYLTRDIHMAVLSHELSSKKYPRAAFSALFLWYVCTAIIGCTYISLYELQGNKGHGNFVIANPRTCAKIGLELLIVILQLY